MYVLTQSQLDTLSQLHHMRFTNFSEPCILHTDTHTVPSIELIQDLSDLGLIDYVYNFYNTKIFFTRAGKRYARLFFGLPHYEQKVKVEPAPEPSIPPVEQVQSESAPALRDKLAVLEAALTEIAYRGGLNGLDCATIAQNALRGVA